MDDSHWFLMKYDDGSVFGPIPFEQLRQWALDAQVSPLDKVSTDEQNWIKAPMVPDLEMDYLVEVTPDERERLKSALVRGRVAPLVRTYLGKSRPASTAASDPR